MEIGLINSFDIEAHDKWPKDYLGFWGNARMITTHLEMEGCALDYFGPLHRRRRLSSVAKRAVYQYLLKKRYYGWADPERGAGYLRQIESRVRSRRHDLLLCLEHAAVVAGLEVDHPLALWTDACLGCQIDFYPYLTNLCSETRKAILQMEQRVIDRCDLFIVASEWARREIFRLYDTDPVKIKVLPRGLKVANPPGRSEVEQMVSDRSLSPCRLLFIGVNWERKGGETALAVVEELNRRGRRAELSIVGCEPDLGRPLPDFVTCHGMINRSTAEGKACFEGLYRNASFTILPTRSDITPGGIGEAFAYGVPGLSTRVGGIPDLVEDGSSGVLFPLGADPGIWCDAIEHLIDDRDAYESMALAAFTSFEETFNWTKVVRSGLQLLTDVVESRTSAAEIR